MSKYLNKYNGISSDQYANFALGFGTFRRYINETSDEVVVDKNRIMAIQFLQDSEINILKDRQLEGNQDGLRYVGYSQGSELLEGKTISQGTIMYGDFTNIKLNSGLAVIFEVRL